VSNVAPTDDVHERLAALEEEVRALREQQQVPYRAVVEDMTELVVRWRPDGTRLFVNDAYCRLFGATREQIVGTSFWPLVSDEDRAQVRARIAALSPQHPVSTGRHRAGASPGEIWMEWVDRAIYDDQGELCELQSVGRDISDRVKLEEQAERIARGDAATRTAAAIGHDLRNVLQVIKGLTSLLREPPREAADVEHIDLAVQAGERLLGQLARVSHGLPADVRRLDLSERVSGLRSLLREVARGGIRLVEGLESGCFIRGDGTQIDQVLLNLVRNAVDAQSGTGQVRIETQVTTAERLQEGYRPTGANDCAVLRVRDDGPGISEAVLPRLFDAHITTKTNGQGLGLATVKAIVDGHGGTIRVETSQRGTTFELAFPRAG